MSMSRLLPPPSSRPVEGLGDDPFLIYPYVDDDCSLGIAMMFDLQLDSHFPVGYTGPTDPRDPRFEARCREHGEPYLDSWRSQR